MGKAGGGMIQTDILFFPSDDSRPKPKNVIQKQYSVTDAPQVAPEDDAPCKPSAAPTAMQSSIATPEDEERKELLIKVKERMRIKIEAKKLTGLSSKEGGKDCLKASKIFLADNCEKLKKQALLLEAEIAEMESEAKRMKEFITKNKERDLSEVIYIPHSFPI